MTLIDDGIYFCRCGCQVEEARMDRKRGTRRRKERIRAKQNLATGKRGNKYKKQRQHGLMRGDQRYELTEHDYDCLIAQIKSERNAVNVRKQNARLSWWNVLYKKRLIRCVYDKRREVIVTFRFAEGEGKRLSDD